MSARAELSTLEASGLIEIAALEPELEYLFRHALVQEAAYATLLKQDRRALHRAAAETILALHPERARELAAVIGMHFEEAGAAAQAAEQLVLAGEHAKERFASREAVAFFRRAGDLADDSQADLRVRAAIGGAQAGWGYSEQAQFIERLERTPVAGGVDPRLAAEAYAWAAFLRRQRGEVPESSVPLREALERASAIEGGLDNKSSAALPRGLLGAFTAMTGRLREGAQEMREALDVIREGGDAVAVAMISDFLAITYARLGEFDAAEDTIARSQRLADAGDAIARVDVEITQSTLWLERGDAEAAAEQASRCSLRAEELGAYACVVASNLTFGAATLARQQAPEAKPALERGNELCRVTNMAPMQTLTRALLGSARAELGDLQGGVEQWNEALTAAVTMNDRYGEAQTLWARGRVRARQAGPDLAAAQADFDRAIELFDAMDARPSLARALHDRAQVSRALGREAEADRDEVRSGELARALGLKDLR